MRYSSPLLATLQSVMGQGGDLDVPEILLPTIDLPMPLMANLPTSTFDHRGVYGTSVNHITINHGASTSALGQNVVTFDRGVYRVYIEIMTTTFAGPPASSASQVCGFAALRDPNGIANAMICVTGLAPLSEAQRSTYEGVLQFTIPGWRIHAGTAVSTGVGQSIAFDASVHVSRLV